MEIIALNELGKVEFSASRVISILQHWKENDVFNALYSPKKTHAFLYFAGCDGLYTFPDGTNLKVSAGDVVFIPAGACYKTSFFNIKEDVTTILMNFQLQTAEGPFSFSEKVTVVSQDPNKIFNKLFFKSAREFKSAKSSIVSMKYYLFRIFHELQKVNKTEPDINSNFAKISKGIYYLENDTEQLLSVDEIAEMCNVSTNTFRRLFNAYAGVSPVEFRLRQRITRAKQLLESEIFTVSEVSDMLNFSDVSYFSRIFKSKTGVSPLEYLNSHRSDFK